MRRIYFLLPNVESAKGIIDELLLKRVEWRISTCWPAPMYRSKTCPQRRLRSAAEVEDTDPTIPAFP
ncbi:hypothetical protein SAMN05445850_3431 [Paraburkholderia tuberum]|uniref:Uncharacterized protein n=1 Tax=Paraburkholderia tuberum TaxID=157910 RepID=A0A1H1HBP5_9BURK|nr:hypothetical protein SAMN05445850_3431 [Paraburkholderia tuberum]